MKKRIAKATKSVKQAGFSIKTLAEIGELEFITSGVTEIDAITGGLPRARVTEFFGFQGVGKTDLLLQCLSAMSHQGKVLYIDAENALNPLRLKEKAGNPDNISITDMHILEEVARFVIDSVNNYDIVVVDSVAALVPKSEYEGQTGDEFVGLKARRMGQWMRQLAPKLGKSRCALVFINQLRQNMSMYGDPHFTPGGKALLYAASLRIKLTTNKADRIIKDGVNLGHWVHAEITKSRISPPYRTAKFKLVY